MHHANNFMHISIVLTSLGTYVQAGLSSQVLVHPTPPRLLVLLFAQKAPLHAMLLAPCTLLPLPKQPIAIASDRFCIIAL